VKKFLIWGIIVSLAASYVIISRFGERDGKTIFRQEGCTSCHVLRGTGFGAIDLSDVTERKTDAWIRDQIKNARLHDPDSGMPGFGHLEDRELDALVGFLHEKN
jgi:cbb3-type cytochrome oxidase cytochrome c subunit